MLPLLHLNQLQAKSWYRMRSVGQAKVIAKACQQVVGELTNSTGHQKIAMETLGQRKQVRAKSLPEDISAPTPPLPLPPKPSSWEEPTVE